jgi:hypothetical protein
LLWLYRSISLISCSISSSLSHALGSGTCGTAQPINALKIKPKSTPIHHATVHAAQTSLTHQFTFPNQMKNQTKPTHHSLKPVLTHQPGSWGFHGGSLHLLLHDSQLYSLYMTHNNIQYFFQKHDLQHGLILVFVSISKRRNTSHVPSPCMHCCYILVLNFIVWIPSEISCYKDNVYI